MHTYLHIHIKTLVVGLLAGLVVMGVTTLAVAQVQNQNQAPASVQVLAKAAVDFGVSPPEVATLNGALPTPPVHEVMSRKNGKINPLKGPL